MAVAPYGIFHFVKPLLPNINYEAWRFSPENSHGFFFCRMPPQSLKNHPLAFHVAGAAPSKKKMLARALSIVLYAGC